MIEDRSYAFSILKKNFLENPFATLKWYLGGKILYSWKWDNIYLSDVYQYPMFVKAFHLENGLEVVHKFMRWLHWPIFWLSVVGFFIFFFKSLRRNLSDSEYLVLVPIFVILYFSIIFSILLPLPRYSIPVRPFAYLMASYATMNVYQILRLSFKKITARQ